MADNDFPSIDKLIELWQQEECLWNISLEGYHKKDLQQLRIIRGPFKCCNCNDNQTQWDNSFHPPQ